MSINEVIKDIMERECVSQVELARRMGVSRQAVQQMLKGNDMMMSTVVTILSVLGYNFTVERSDENA